MIGNEKKKKEIDDMEGHLKDLLTVKKSFKLPQARNSRYNFLDHQRSLKIWSTKDDENEVLQPGPYLGTNSYLIVLLSNITRQSKYRQNNQEPIKTVKVNV